MTNPASATSAPETGATESQNQPSGAPPTSTADDTARNIRTPDKRQYPNDYPVTWLRGRTADEAGNLFNNIYTGMLGDTPTPQMANPAPVAPVPPPAPAPVANALPSEDDWITNPQAATTKYIEHLQQTQLNPMLDQQASQLGSMARNQVVVQEKESFDRWAPEIDQLIGSIDPRQRTIENIQMAVDLVKGRHAHEISQAAVKAEVERLQETGFSMRADGTVSPVGAGPSAPDGIDLDMDKLPPKYAEVLQRNNVTVPVLREFLQKTECDKKGISMQQAFEEWLKDATTGDLVPSSEVF